MTSPINNIVIKQDMENIYKRNIEWELLRNKAILVTGAYGMLASYLVFFLAYLNEVHNMNIIVIAQGRSIDKMRKRFGELFLRDYFIFTDINLNSYIDIEQKIDYIIHAAGGTNPRLYSTNPVEIADVNTIGTYNLLKLAVKKSVSGFLYFSSGDVYGQVDLGITDIEEDVAGKLDPLSPHACYSEAKRMGETFCNIFWKEYSVPTKIARIGHTYAPTMDIENDSRVFASFIKCIVDKKDIEMLSDGTAKRPFCYIADAVAAYFLILLKGTNGEAYNVCNTTEFLSISQLADIMVGLRPTYGLRVIRKERTLDDKYVENTDNKENKPVSTKLINLGWKPQFTAAEGFEQVLRYVL